jgi:hypothetical protein
MSVSFAIPTNGYADLVPIISSLRNKGNIYYFNNAPTEWSIWYVSDDGSILVELAGATGSFPSTFATDFPGAIQLSVEPTILLDKS